MKHLKLIIACAATAAASYAQTIAISGTVTECANGNAVAGAYVRLAVSGLSDTTGSDGRFELVNHASNVLRTGGLTGSLAPVSFSAGRITARLGQNAVVRITVYSPQGRRVFEYEKHHGPGNHTVSLPVHSCGLFICEAAVGKDVYISRISFNGKTGSPAAAFSPAGQKRNAAAKTDFGYAQASGLSKTTQAFRDTLIVIHGDYGTVKILVTEPFSDSFSVKLYEYVPCDCPPGMVRIPSGGQNFEMGSIYDGAGGREDPVGRSFDRPVHTVSFTYDYCMAATEVTQDEYETVMRINPSWFIATKEQPFNREKPVEIVTWFDAALYSNALSKRYGLDTVYSYTGKFMFVGAPQGWPWPMWGTCSSLTDISIDYSKNGFRLPTEAEWEFAAKAGTQTDYYWGENYGPYPASEYDSLEIGTYETWYGNSGSKPAAGGLLGGSYHPDYGTHPVGTKLPNPFGLYDMLGNVSEWINDWYAGYTEEPKTDPRGPAEPGTSSYVVMRGGSWGSHSQGLRSTARHPHPRRNFGNNSGFRIVRAVE